MDEYEILIPLFTFFSVCCLGAAVITGSIVRKETLHARLHGQRKSMGDKNADRPVLVRIFTQIGSTVSPKGYSSGLRKQMVRAGFHGRESVAVFLGAKVFLFMVALVALGVLTASFDIPPSRKLLLVVGGATVLFFVPNLYVKLRAQSRSGDVRRHLPDVVDLLEICVSGGMGLDMAWNSVADEVRVVTPLLADEMVLTNLEMHLGEDRGSAIRHMADRTGADELFSLVAVLVQSHKFGTSVSDALRVFAKGMRELRSQRAEESAEKMAVKMLFPMTVLIFPVVLIVAVGPAAITLIQVFGGN